MNSGIELPTEARVRYFERRKKDVELLRQALDSKNPVDFKRIGHQLKGNAATFGFPELANLAQELESAGHLQDWVKLSELLNAMETWLGRNRPN